MPNINLAVNASQRRKSQIFNQRQKKNTFPLKKVKQNETERLRTYTPPFQPAIVPLTTPPSANCSPKLKVNSPLALSITFLMLLSNFRTVDAIENGTAVEDSAMKDLHPLVHQNIGNRTLSVCSSVKLNNHQVLTAGHCEYIKFQIGDFTFRTKADLCIENRLGECIPVESTVKHHRLDMAILTTKKPFSSYSYNTCPPKLMGQKVYKQNRSHSASKNPCGGQAPHIILARGAKNDTITGARDHSLSFGEFVTHKKDPFIAEWSTLQLESKRGITENAENTRAVVTSGDSGGPVYTCNKKSKKYELSGLVKGGRLDSDICFITKTATRSTSRWIRENSEHCDERTLDIGKILFTTNQ